jgi:hypothetical protein
VDLDRLRGRRTLGADQVAVLDAVADRLVDREHQVVDVCR